MGGGFEKPSTLISLGRFICDCMNMQLNNYTLLPNFFVFLFERLRETEWALRSLACAKAWWELGTESTWVSGGLLLEPSLLSP